MKKWMVSFAINNRQEEYAQCLDIIEYIGQEGELSVCREFLGQIRFAPYEDRMELEGLITGRYWKNADCELAALVGEREVSYLFRVKSADDNDIANLLYYCLLCDKVGKNCTLCVECDQKTGANIRDFLSWLLGAGAIGSCYTYIGGTCREISTHRAETLRYIWKDGKVGKSDKDALRVMKQFSPIFRIDASFDEHVYGSVGYWRQSMGSFLRKLYSSMNDAGEKMPRKDEESGSYNYGKDYFLPHSCPTDLRSSCQGELWRGYACAREKHLLNNFVECFCTTETGSRESVDFTRERYAWWKSERLYEQIKEIPLLAMYIFCVSDYFSRDIDNDTWEKIEEEIVNARDMADGVLQLLENIYHSESKKGYFCFRVHKDSSDRSGQYLRKEYKDYMEVWDENGNAPLDFLEIKIADFSHLSIPIQFYKDFEHRMEAAEKTDRKVYQSLACQAGNLGVASFFGTDDESWNLFWNKYNSISENAVHHYGLQVFESLIACYDGYFQVKSQETRKLKRDRELYSTHGQSSASDMVEYALPGTQYDILMPFRRQVQLQNLSLNVNINYTDGLLADYAVCEGIEFTRKYCREVVESVNEEYPDISYQECKEQVIRVLADRLNERIRERRLRNGKKQIIHFSAGKISMTATELFCKAVMLNISRKSPKEGFYVMITECTPSHFVEITRMFALFYNKQGENLLMENTQIFMSGKKEGEEFLITGSNLGEAIGSTEKLAFARCTHPDCLKTLKKTLRNHKMGVKPNEMVSIVPFDMIRYDAQKETLLEQRLGAVLAQDLQSEKFGCKLENLHVRIGSKIHVQTFYEAELLLHNNYYTSRFAYWLYNRLCANRNLKKKAPFVLVGYEDYSEMLLNELAAMFINRGIKTEYLIYEERIIGKFRGKSPFEKYKDYQIVIIVPINSTMTTHIKIAGFFEKAIKESLKNNGDDTYTDYKLDKVFNYGIVLISSEKPNSYWEKITSAADDKKVLKSKINGKKLEYYIEAAAKWETPLKCSACFPEEDYTREVPMVETNKESVVPMHAISMRKPENAGSRNLPNDSDEQIADLSKFLVYKHVERNGNHFNYYFATEKLWDFPDVREKVRHWLEEKAGELFGKEKCKVYDIIVAPLHYSNTVFVEEVNGCLFKNAALVLHFDADREFRMNVKTKYSSIQQLYDNLCTDCEESIINFHYVDDTIVSGRTFRRMKSLIASMVRQKDSANIQINIFKSIVLLLNRMSSSSIDDYISDKKYFLSYYNLQISSMRVNADACVLCKKYSEWSRLAQQASLNRVFKYWQNRARLLKCIPVEEIEMNKEEDPEKTRRNEQYMLASHKAKQLLDFICDSGDNAYIEEMVVKELFPEDVSQSVDALIAMLKILGRPFLTFRREEREVVFKLMLVMLDTLLAESEPAGEDKLNLLLRQIWGNNDHRDKIVEILLNRLAELESNYIMRKRSMNRILEFSGHMEEGKQKEFVDNYLNRLKQLVGQSNDFAKGLYLEYLLLYDEEYTGQTGFGQINSLEGKDRYTAFKRNMFLENTKLINYGIEYLAKGFLDFEDVNEKNLIEELNQNYYFDNFIQYLFFHKVVEMKGKERVKKFASLEEQKKLAGMVRFELLYQQIFGNDARGIPESKESFTDKASVEEENLKDTFTQMMEFLKDAGGALDGEIIVPFGEAERKKYIALGLGASTELRSLENTDRQMWEFMEANKDFEEDTYKICRTGNTEKENRKWVLLKFLGTNDSGNDDISVIFLLFPYGTQKDGEIIHALKNILVFRHKIWKILNLSSGTLLHNLTNNLFYKQQMLKSRAVGHSDLDTLIGQLGEFAKPICNEVHENEMTPQNDQLRSDYFNLLVNSLIGCMNAQVLGNRCTDRLEKHGQSFMNFWEAEQVIFGATSKLWKLKIEIDSQGLENYRIRPGTKLHKGKTVWPCGEVLLVLFLTVFHNIWAHGRQSEDRIYKVNIFVENGILCISNCIDENSKNKVEKAITAEAYRSGEGISQAVIYDICQNWYGGLKYEDTFVLQEAGGTAKKEWQYVVRLPIIEIIERKGEHAEV